MLRLLGSISIATKFYLFDALASAILKRSDFLKRKQAIHLQDII